jgi:hypothetical protein
MANYTDISASGAVFVTEVTRWLEVLTFFEVVC